MGTSALHDAPAVPRAATALEERDAGYDAFMMLRLAFTVAPID